MKYDFDSRAQRLCRGRGHRRLYQRGRLAPSEATYLLWLDCSALPGTAKEIAAHIRRKTGLYLSEGSQYGNGGEHFLRMNVACPRATLEDGLARLRAGIASYEAFPPSRRRF